MPQHAFFKKLDIVWTSQLAHLFSFHSAPHHRLLKTTCFCHLTLESWLCSAWISFPAQILFHVDRTCRNHKFLRAPTSKWLERVKGKLTRATFCASYYLLISSPQLFLILQFGLSFVFCCCGFLIMELLIVFPLFWLHVIPKIPIILCQVGVKKVSGEVQCFIWSALNLKQG